MTKPRKSPVDAASHDVESTGSAKTVATTTDAQTTVAALTERTQSAGWRWGRQGLYGLLFLYGALIIGDFGYSLYVDQSVRRFERSIRFDEQGVREGCQAYEKGSGQTAILLIHGFNDSPRIWDEMAEQLAAAGFACRAMRLPGFASRHELYGKYTLDQWRRAVIDEVNELRADHDRVIVMGHSLGGALALRLALDAQDSLDTQASLEPQSSGDAQVSVEPPASVEPLASQDTGVTAAVGSAIGESGEKEQTTESPTQDIAQVPAIDGLVLIAPAIEVANDRSPVLTAAQWNQVSRMLLFFTNATASPYPIDAVDPAALAYPYRTIFTPRRVIEQTFQLLTMNRQESPRFSFPIFVCVAKHDHVVDSDAAAQWWNRIEAPRKELFHAQNSAHFVPLDHDRVALVEAIVSFLAANELVR